MELSTLLDPLTGPKLTSLSQLLVKSVHATTSAINLLSQLFAVKGKLPPPTETGVYVHTVELMRGVDSCMHSIIYHVTNERVLLLNCVS